MILFFGFRDEKSKITKNEVFDFILETGMQEVTIAPGESYAVSPIIINNSTKPLYAFIEITMPSCNDEGLYDIEVWDEWTLIESSSTNMVFAYGTTDQMTEIHLDGITGALTDKVTMKNITNGQYAQISDVNINVRGYAIGTDLTGPTPTEAWGRCKELGEQ